jgi:FixJ family two-component response regulator
MNFSEDRPNARPVVLIVEDDDSVRRSLQLLLRSAGLDVRAHESSTAAVADPLALECDCLVADLMMPDLSGIALLRLLREKGWKGPAILISGFVTPAATAEALDAGFMTILPKPIPEAFVVREVRKALNGRMPTGL